MELTLRTPAAIGAWKEITAKVPGMLAGIGTILTTDQVKEVVDAGAAFGVAPGMNPRIVEAALAAVAAVAPRPQPRDPVKPYPGLPDGLARMLAQISAS